MDAGEGSGGGGAGGQAGAGRLLLPSGRSGQATLSGDMQAIVEELQSKVRRRAREHSEWALRGR